MIHRIELERIRSALLERQIDFNDELKNLPEGSLYSFFKDDRWYYYQVMPPKGKSKKRKRVGITRDADRVFALVRKSYIEKALPLVEKDIKVLEGAIGKYACFDEETVMEDYLVKHPALRDGIYHGVQSDASWAEDYETQKDFFERERRHVSSRGVTMRSKNEVYIASRLDHYKIPYRYEHAVMHLDVFRVPDFTIRRPRDNKIIYWEHLGLTGDGEYINENDRKFADYRRVNIVPWDNLMVTYDRPDGGLDAKIIEGMIQGWLL